MKLKIIRAGDAPDTSHWKQGFIYVVKPTHSNVYKIGETDNLERRLSQLKKKFDFDLEYVFTHPSSNCFGLEQRLHMNYDRYHLGGDWFALTDGALRDLIAYAEGAR
jgi:hypothetical protein